MLAQLARGTFRVAAFVGAYVAFLGIAATLS